MITVYDDPSPQITSTSSPTSLPNIAAPKEDSVVILPFSGSDPIEPTNWKVKSSCSAVSKNVTVLVAVILFFDVLSEATSMLFKVNSKSLIFASISACLFLAAS